MPVGPGKGGGLDTTVLLIAALVIFTVAALLSTAMYLKCQNSRHKMAAHVASKPSDPTMHQSPHAATVGGDLTKKALHINADPPYWPEQNRGEYPDAACLSMSSPDQPYHSAPVHSYHSAPVHSNHSSRGAINHNVRSVAAHKPQRPVNVIASRSEHSFFHCNSLSPPPIQSRYTGSSIPVRSATLDSFGSQLPNSMASSHTRLDGRDHSNLRGAARGEDRAALEVASTLGSSAYEQTMMQWYPGEQGRESSFVEGLPVRIVGLVTEPTWEGAEGVVYSYDPREGMVRIEFPDGRTKSVPEQNCEEAANIPQNRKHGSQLERRGHGGVKALPQGSARKVIR